MSGNDILKSLHGFRSWWKPFSVTHGYPTSPGRTLPYMAIASHWDTSKHFLIWASRCVETIVKHGIFEEFPSVELLHNVSCLLSSVYLNQLCAWRTLVRQWNSFTEDKQASRRWTLSNQQLWQKLMARLSMQLQHLNRRCWYLKTFIRMLLAQNCSWMLLCLQDCPHYTFFLPGAGFVLLLSALVPPL